MLLIIMAIILTIKKKGVHYVQQNDGERRSVSNNAEL